MNEAAQESGQHRNDGREAAEQLLPLIYHELRSLAAAKLAQEAPGQTLQPTALVHEAWLRLTENGEQPCWDSRAHFFAAAAEAMRRIVVERARGKARQKHGGKFHRVPLHEDAWVTTTSPEKILAVDEALSQLALEDPIAADIVKLRYFSGMSMDESAELLEIHRATAYRHWSYARAWIRAWLQSGATGTN